MRVMVRIAVDGFAVLAAALLVPGITIELGDEAAGALLILVVIAIPFGLGNRLVRPMARLASIPLRLLTLGLFSALVNGSMLLLVAFVLDAVSVDVLTVGGFPPELDIAAIGAAAAAGVIIAVISTMMAFAIRDP